MKPKVKHSQIVYSGYFNLRQDLLERSDGKTHPYTSMILSTDSIAILAQTPDGLWILNREYRHPTGKVLLGPPSGRLNQKEDPIAGARRELIEETGYLSDEIVVLGCCHPFPGLCDQKMFYLWAKNAIRKSEPNLEPFEFIEVELMSDERLRKEIRGGTDVDGNLCIALWYKDHFC